MSTGYKSHHTPQGFQNPQQFTGPGMRDLLRWRLERFGKPIRPAASYHFTLAKNDPLFLYNNRDRTTVTWIGHATLLVQIAGLNILTDPHFSSRASPLSWIGPHRVVPPGIALDELPEIDLVVISHDHYDSLDRATIQALRRRTGGAQTRFLVPLGLGNWFRHSGIENVGELDWWQSEFQGPVNATAFPVQHWSKRKPFQRNRTLWAGWTLCSDQFRFLFLGDTGYTPLLREIGERLGPFDLAAIPIGAYDPRWFMHYSHLAPEESVQAMVDLQAREAVAIHWGTFILTDEPLDEPPKRLRVALEAAAIDPARFHVLQHGETLFPH